MPGLQEWIYKLEEGGGAKIIKVALAVLVFLALAVFHDVRKFRNFTAPEAMDQAQVARNIAEGKGFTTRFIRPLSIHLVRQKDPTGDAKLGGQHPDLANAPVYPLALAGLMKVLPFDFTTELRPGFRQYQPDLLIAFFNQTLFLLAAVLLFLLARRLFDDTVAWASVILFVGAEVFWRFSLSGLSTMLLVVILLGLSFLLVRIDESARSETAPAAWRLIALAALIGVVTGIAGLTRYSFAWMIAPVVFFLVVFMPRMRWGLGLAAFMAFAVVMTPWLARNYSAGGKFFGTAGYAVVQETLPLPGTQLERSLDPSHDLGQVMMRDYFRKFVNNTRDILQHDLTRLGGSWVGAFFLVGLLIPFRNLTLSRLRIFLVLSLLLLTVVQAMGRTHLAAESPEINSENLLVVLAPLVIVFGAGFFFILLEQINVPIPQFRPALTALFLAAMCAPLLVSLGQSRVHPVAYPPYLPPLIQKASGWMKEGEMIMSDIPWAVAWYGDCQSVWLTLNRRAEFFKLHDEIKSVQALYITERTMNSPMASEAIVQEEGWARLGLEVMVQGGSKGFPLTRGATGFLPGQLFLADWERWDFAAK